MTLPAEIILQSIRYQLFSFLPQLSLRCQNKHKLISDFYAENSSKLNMDWRLPVTFLNWLCNQKAYSGLIDEAVMTECLISAVLRWSLRGLEHCSAKGIVLISQHLAGKGVGLWKSETADAMSKLVIIKHVTPLTDAYAISYQQGSWEGVKWMALAD